MRLQVRSDETMIFYPLATWSWDEKYHHLIQRIPEITEVRITVSGMTTEPVKVPEHMIRPSLQIGQEAKLDDTVYYVANIEFAPRTKEFYGQIYLYYMSEIPPVVPAFWTVEVTPEEEYKP